ncbi:glycosyltransferase [Candidatus Micrarchaeota archaeon]|nr:glycosyltransferase [Candidatus Micrarchaeota archaeon]
MISVIIPAKNEEVGIGPTILSLKNQDFKGEYEIILVDGNSSDRTVEIAKKHIKDVYVQTPKGPAGARNYGAEKAKYEIIAFIDADCIARRDWLSRIAKNFEDKKLIGLGGILKPSEPRLIDTFMFTLFSNWWVRVSSYFGLWQLYGNNCAYRKKEFLKVKGFSTAVSFFEDTELSMRIRKDGRLKVDGNLVVYTSTRRFKQKGYAKVFRQNTMAFINFLRGSKIDTPYFETIKKGQL